MCGLVSNHKRGGSSSFTETFHNWGDHSCRMIPLCANFLLYLKWKFPYCQLFKWSLFIEFFIAGLLFLDLVISTPVCAPLSTSLWRTLHRYSILYNPILSVNKCNAPVTVHQCCMVWSDWPFAIREVWKVNQHLRGYIETIIALTWNAHSSTTSI